MKNIKVRKTGNSPLITIPKAITQALKLSKGSQVEMTIRSRNRLR
ncbi:AbrB/MazE/SpoVT family DNA-binding domain-containing protein, partial [Aliivibrio kagoshimensis]